MSDNPNPSFPVTTGAFATVEDYLSSVRAANYLSRVGGPYPDDPLLRIAPSLYDALGMILSRELDPVPRTPLDKRLGDGMYFAARGICPSWCSWILACIGLNAADRAASKLEEQIKRHVWQVQKTWPREYDPTLVSLHLEHILALVGSLVFAGNLDELPVLRKMAQLAFDGYLPVEISPEGDTEYVIVY